MGNGNGTEMKFRIKSTTPLLRAMNAYHAKTNTCLGDYKFIYNGCRIDPESTPDDVCMGYDDYIEVYRDQVGGKPVIYLTSPREVDAKVRLSLVPSWKLSAHYPATPISNSSTNQSVEWQVSTRADGTLRENTIGVDVAYLFWEAQ